MICSGRGRNIGEVAIATLMRKCKRLIVNGCKCNDFYCDGSLKLVPGLEKWFNICMRIMLENIVLWNIWDTFNGLMISNLIFKRVYVPETNMFRGNLVHLSVCDLLANKPHVGFSWNMVWELFTKSWANSKDLSTGNFSFGKFADTD
jgi:hypothetical protein